MLRRLTSSAESIDFLLCRLRLAVASIMRAGKRAYATKFHPSRVIAVFSDGQQAEQNPNYWIFGISHFSTGFALKTFRNARSRLADQRRRLPSPSLRVGVRRSCGVGKTGADF